MKEETLKGVFYYSKFLLMCMGCYWTLDPKSTQIKKILYRIYCNVILDILVSGTTMLTVNVPILFIQLGAAVACTTGSIAVGANLMVSKGLYFKTKSAMRIITTAMAIEREIILAEDTPARKIYMEHVEICDKFSKSAMYGYGFLYACLIVIGIAKVSYEIKQPKEERDPGKANVLELWTPLSTEQKERYIVWMTAYQVAFLGCAVLAVVTYTITNHAVMTYFKARLKVLQWYFSNTAAPKSIEQLVTVHQQIISQVTQYNEETQGIVFLEYLLNTVGMSMGLFAIVEGVEIVRNTLIVGIISLRYMSVSYIANDIIVESLALGDALYESKWYQKDPKYAKRIVCFMIHRCQKPLSISLGPFGDMTAYTGMQRIKAAYSYTSMMSGVKGT